MSAYESKVRRGVAAGAARRCAAPGLPKDGRRRISPARTISMRTRARVFRTAACRTFAGTASRRYTSGPSCCFPRIATAIELPTISAMPSSAMPPIVSPHTT